MKVEGAGVNLSGMMTSVEWNEGCQGREYRRRKERDEKVDSLTGVVMSD